MRWLTLVFFWAFLIGAAADMEGARSAADHGLRARFFTRASTDPTHDSTYSLDVEFENVPIVGSLGPIEEARIFEYSELNWKLDVTGPDGKTLPQAGPGVFDYPSQGWLICLPPGGTISFPVAAGGDTAPKSLVSQPSANVQPASAPLSLAGGYLHFSPALGWVIPPGGASYLLGTFSSSPKRPERGRPRVNWRGTLALPAVLIPER